MEWRPEQGTSDCQAANAAAAGSTSNLSIPAGWCVRTAYTFEERYADDVPFSVSLYEVPEPQLTRDMFTYLRQPISETTPSLCR